MHPKTKQAADFKQAERERLVAEMEAELGTLDEHPEDKEVLDATAMDIVSNLKTRKEGWSCERVMCAFIRSACAAQRKTNCLTEVLFRQALEEARAKDKEIAGGKSPQGEFWGLPSSFKDTYNIIDVDTSLGCSHYCNEPTVRAEDEGTLVKIFRQEGGIPFCKTNIPQTLLAFECANPIFGASSNPHASSRVPGGSSGGEAALVTLRGTPVGWGSDIGGSLRIPAAYSGCVGLKPAVGRWPGGGSRPTAVGFDGIKPVVGPMARTVDEIIFSSRIMLNRVAEDINEKGYCQTDNVVPLPWREPNLPKRLKIGYWVEDGTVRTSPANRRAVLETVAALKKEGHELVQWKPPRVWYALKIFAALTSADGYKQLLGNVGRDPREPAMNLVTLGTRLPRFLMWLAINFVRFILKDIMFASIFSVSRRKNIDDYMYWTGERDAYTREFRKAAWEDEKFDFLLCAPQAVPAMEHGRTKDLSPLALGTLLFNVVDSTAGVLPVTRVDPARDAATAADIAGPAGSWILQKKVYGGSDPAYDAKKMAGLPVGVQIVGRQFEDEKVLAMMKIVESAMAFDA